MTGRPAPRQWRNRAKAGSRSRRLWPPQALTAFFLGLIRMRLLQETRQEEGELQRLVCIEARVAMGVIAVLQFVVANGARTARTFGDVLAGSSRYGCRPDASPRPGETSKKVSTSLRIRSKGRVL